MTKTTDEIIQLIADMPEEEVRTKFAELMLNFYSIGFDGYSEEKCINDYKSIYKNSIFRKLVKK
ncbi:hypothetical protein NXZ75_13665 [Lysinibacillus sphaericus]|uniref:hypothetical protein n=1 Tax=Lysinibacillus sphaericus TaxID=1421 RepID=UPI0021619DAB|nr:hypothetical protein [Lysinibacillus sphaericus]MCS1383249.1 hypothetical protein [Lysinibacillus sphaericus]